MRNDLANDRQEPPRPDEGEGRAFSMLSTRSVKTSDRNRSGSRHSERSWLGRRGPQKLRAVGGLPRFGFLAFLGVSERHELEHLGRARRHLCHLL